MSEKERITEKPKRKYHTLKGFFEKLDQSPGYKIVEDHSNYESVYHITYTDSLNNIHLILVDANETVLQLGHFRKLTHITHKIAGEPLCTDILLSNIEYSTQQYLMSDEEYSKKPEINRNKKRIPVSRTDDCDTQVRQILQITMGGLDIIDYARYLTSRDEFRLDSEEYNGKHLKEVYACLPYREHPYYDPIYIGKLTLNKALNNEIPECENTPRIF